MTPEIEQTLKRLESMTEQGIAALGDKSIENGIELFSGDSGREVAMRLRLESIKRRIAKL